MQVYVAQLSGAFITLGIMAGIYVLPDLFAFILPGLILGGIAHGAFD